MAKATTNFSSWSLIETLLDGIKTFENSSTYSSLENTVSNLATYLFNISNWTGTSSSVSYSNSYYAAAATGSNFGKTSYKITSANISDNSGNTLSITGSVKLSGGTITGISFNGDGYSETVVGKIYSDNSKPAVFTSWNRSIPLDSGTVTFSGTGTRTEYSDTNVKTVFKTMSISYGSYYATVSDLKYTTYGDPADLDYVDMLEAFFSGNDKLIGSSGADELRGYAGNDELRGYAGDDVLLGGTGSDKFIIDSGVDSISDLGDGADIMTVSLGASAEAIVVNSWIATSKTINNGSASLNSHGFNLNLSAIKSGNGFDLTNTSAQASFIGSQKNDVLNGGTGIDTLNGHLGNDTLVGNSGADIFVFNTKLNATNNVDIIEGFEQGTDIIHLDDAIFSKLKNINLSADNIYVVNDVRDANGKNDFLVYNASTGALSYDADGIGSKAPIQFATLLLGAGQDLSISDFLII
jgi:Ca2+-binding RTX toxin-like protein